MAEGIKIGELYTELLLDKSKYGSGLTSAEKQTKGFGGKMSSIFTGIGISIGQSLAHAAEKVVDFAKDAIDAAEVQERAQNLVEAAYGKSADAIISWAEKNSVAMAAADDDIETSLSSYEMWAKNVGKSTKDATADGEELAQRASEIAQATGGSFTDVFAALLKGEQGATKGLKSYGVAVSTTAIKQQAMKMGLYDGTGALSDQAKAAALHAIIMQQTAKYTSAAADAQDSLAVQSKRSGVIWNEAMESIGTALTPVVSAVLTALVPAFQAFGDWVSENAPALSAAVLAAMDNIMGALGAVVSAVQPLIDAFNAVLTVVADFLGQNDALTLTLEALAVLVGGALTVAFASWAASVIAATWPILAVVAAVVAVIAILDKLGILQPIVQAATEALGAAFQWVQSNVLPALAAAFDWLTSNVLPALGAVFDWIRTNILPPVMSVIDTITNVILPALGEAFGAVVSWVQANWPLISKVFNQVAGVVSQAVGVIADVVKSAFDIVASVIKAVSPVIVKVGEVVFPIVGDAATALLNIISAVFDAIGDIWQTAWDVAKAIAKGIGDAWSGLVGVFKTVGDGIAGVVKNSFNFVISIINGIIKAIDSIQVHIGRIGMDTPAGFVGVGPFDWDGVKIPTLPMLAKGMWDVPAPMVAVLHAGEAVLPATAADAYRKNRAGFGDRGGSGSSGPTIAIGTINGVLPGDVERETRRALRRSILDAQLQGAGA